VIQVLKVQQAQMAIHSRPKWLMPPDANAIPLVEAALTSI
jgi:hypothetical protein